MATVHTVTLRAVDGVSQTFVKAGQSARTMATEIDRAGQASQTASARMDGLGRAATAMGAALGTGVGLLATLGQQAVNQERSIAGLGVAYGEAADQVVEFSRQIQASTNYSDEAARQALTIASTLTRNYGLSADAVEELITASANLAQVYGYDLADAVQRTSSAIRGEAESAEALGLTLSDSFVAAEAAKRGMEGWTTSMTENEKAQFRLQLLLEQTTYAEGQAAEAAEGVRGTIVEMTHAVQDAAVGVGQFIGPVGQAASVAGDFALILPAAGAALGKLASGGPAAARGLQALLGALTPLNIGLGAAAVAAGLVIKVWADNEQANRDLATSYTDLTDVIRETQTASQQLASQNVRFDFPVTDQSIALLVNGLAIGSAEFEAFILRTEEQTEANDLLARSFANVAPEGVDPLIAAMDRLETSAETFAITGDDALGVLRSINEILAYTGDGSDRLHGMVDRLNQAYADGNIELPIYLQYLEYIAENQAEVALQTGEAATATEALTEAQQNALRNNVVEGLEAQSARYNALAESIAAANQAMTGVGFDSGRGFGATSGGLDATRQAAQSMAADRDDDAQAALDQARAVEEHIEALADERAAALDTANALVGSYEERQNAASQAADAEADYAQQVGEIQRASLEQQRELEQGYAREVRGFQAERVDLEREAVRTLKDLEMERREVVLETETALRDLAEERGQVQVDLAEQARDAEQEWLSTSRENLREQAALRSELQRTTAEAAREWQALNAENLAQQRAIKDELRDTLQSGNTDFRRNRQDIEREMLRVREDRDIALADPNLAPEDRLAIEMAAERQLEDLKIQLRRAEQDHDRQQKQAKADARAEEKALEDDRKAAADDYHSEVRSLEAETATQIRALEQERMAAQAALAQQQADLQREAQTRLTEIAAQERAVLEEQATRFTEIEREKELATRDAARARQTLAREAANAETQFQKETAQAQREAARETAQAAADYQDQAVASQSELDDLLARGLITRGEYNAALDAATKIQQDSVALERAKLAAEVKQLPEMARLVELELERVSAARDYGKVVSESTGGDPLDGPVVSVKADSREFDQTIETARRTGDDFAATSFVATIDGDSIPWTKIVQGATNRGTGLSGATFRPKIDGDASLFDDVLQGVKDDIAEMEGQAVTVAIMARTGYGEDSGRSQSGGSEPISAALDAVKIELKAMEGRSVEVDIKADTTAFWAAVRNITNRSNVGTATIRLEAEAEEESLAADSRSAQRIPFSAMSVDLGGGSVQRGSGTISTTGGSPQTAKGGASVMNFYGPVTVTPPNANVAAEISRQFATRQRT